MERTTKVLFVCLGNACRSPMAEKLCNLYGKGKVIADSAGVHPALPNVLVDLETIEVMKEVGIDISSYEPKHIDCVDISSFDVVVNMSPFPASEILRLYSPNFKGKVIEWKITDPRGRPKEIYRSVRDCLKEKVLELIRELNANNQSGR